MKRMAIVLVAVFVAATAAVLMAADHTYVGADKCKMCHKVEYNSWMETTHARPPRPLRRRPTVSSVRLPQVPRHQRGRGDGRSSARRATARAPSTRR